MNPSIRYARENDIIRDIEIGDKIERVSLLSKKAAKSFRRKDIKYCRVTLTGDVNQGVSPGLPSEGSHLISNAGTRRISMTLSHHPMRDHSTTQHTLLRRASSLLDTTLNMSSSGSKSPFATISSAARPISVLQSGESSESAREG